MAIGLWHGNQHRGLILGNAGYSIALKTLQRPWLHRIIFACLPTGTTAMVGLGWQTLVSTLHLHFACYRQSAASDALLGLIQMQETIIVPGAMKVITA